MGTCNISTQNGGGLQAQAALDAPVYYNYPYLLGLVGSRHGSAIHWGPKKRSMRFWGEEEGRSALSHKVASCSGVSSDEGRGGARRRLKPPRGFISPTL